VDDAMTIIPANADQVGPVAPTDLPPSIISLARAIVRDCASAGLYVVTLNVSPYTQETTIVQTARVEVIRKTECCLLTFIAHLC
jgi:hypothetical protein